MIEMWDEIFSKLNPSIRDVLEKGEGINAFELMHRELDKTWSELYRVLKSGGFACINIGDATRTINKDFRLYANHSRILNDMQQLGFHALPVILWRKQTNAPNKFMGSGMLPAGAYVTLEHEYILIFRKGSKREFATDHEKEIRRQSAMFWEERNKWFSDVWFDIKGARQHLGNSDFNRRSGAYPLELAHRLINMYSVKEDIVLDPFSGTGTTMAAAMGCGRNSIGYEIDPSLCTAFHDIPLDIVHDSNRTIHSRLQKHLEFCSKRLQEKGPMKHTNIPYGFPVVTAQEKNLFLNNLVTVETLEPNRFEVTYSSQPQPEFCKDWGSIKTAPESTSH
jgi:DNA modification methylase